MRFTRVTGLLAAALLCIQGCDTRSQPSAARQAPAAATDTGKQRPKFEVTTNEVFSTEDIPAYAGNHADIYAHIDTNLDDHIAQLQRWVRQPSVSAQGTGIQEMAEMVRSDFQALGFSEAELVETDGHPGVWGYYDADADTTLMMYFMYDVQPVNPEDWETPPFEGNIVDHDLGRVLMARGATNQKGPERAMLNALSSIIAVRGSLPVNLMIVAEGEEELGSPHFPQIVDQYEDRMRQADGVFFPFNSQDTIGEITMPLGVKGINYWEMEAKGGDWGGPRVAEIHGSLKIIVDSPVWRLVQALASMTSEDGNTILIDGYYEGLRGPNDEESRLINSMVANQDDVRFQQALGVSRWIDGLTGVDAIIETMYLPSLNINGIWGGYAGVGTKTILPHMATAKVDSRLPPGVDPQKMMQLVRAHLDRHGYEDIEIRQLGGYPAAHTSVSSDLVQASIGVFKKYGISPRVNPWITGSAPFYQFSSRLELPMVFTGMGYGTGAHAPNEIMVIEPIDGSGIKDLAGIEKSYVDILYALAEAAAAR